MKHSPGAVARVLSSPGRMYTLYLEGRSPVELQLDLPPGRWRAEWVNPVDGAVLQALDMDHAGAIQQMTSPSFTESVALRIMRL